MTSDFSPDETVTLPPSYLIPVGLGVLALPIAALQLWVGGAIALFALFLLIQTVTLRLVFTAPRLWMFIAGSAAFAISLTKTGNCGKSSGPQCPSCFTFERSTAFTFCRCCFSPPPCGLS
jgi:hypothetical protein